jgi:hypothetical protein
VLISYAYQSVFFLLHEHALDSIYWIKEEFINIEKVNVDDTCKFVPESAYEGALYPLEGGMNETIKKVGIEKNDVTFIGVSSLEAFDKSLQNINPNKIPNKIALPYCIIVNNINFTLNGI